MIYEDEDHSPAQLFEMRKENVCSVCRGTLDVFQDFDKSLAFMACKNDKSHEGIERVYLPAPRMEEYTIKAREEMMTEDHGKEKATALAKYQGATSLTQAEAHEILITPLLGRINPRGTVCLSIFLQQPQWVTLKRSLS